MLYLHVFEFMSVSWSGAEFELFTLHNISYLGCNLYKWGFLERLIPMAMLASIA